MKVLVNYVIQNVEYHVHQSEIIEITSPPYTYSSDVPMNGVMKWLERKQMELLENQKVVITSLYNL